MSSLGNVKSLLIHATIWMNLKILMLSQISLAKLERVLYDSIYIKFLRLQTNQSIVTEIRQVVTRGGVEGGMD